MTHDQVRILTPDNHEPLGRGFASNERDYRMDYHMDCDSDDCAVCKQFEQADETRSAMQEQMEKVAAALPDLSEIAACPQDHSDLMLAMAIRKIANMQLAKGRTNRLRTWFDRIKAEMDRRGLPA